MRARDRRRARSARASRVRPSRRSRCGCAGRPRSRPSRVGLGLRRARARCSACRTRRSSAPTGRGRHPLLLVAIPCFVGGGRARPAAAAARAPAVFAAALFVHHAVLRVALAAARRGHRLDRALFVGPRGEGKNEYLPALPAFDYGPRFLLDRFAELVPSLPVHGAGHPPGLLLVMHYLGLDTAPRLAAFCILVGRARARR